MQKPSKPTLTSSYENHQFKSFILLIVIFIPIYLFIGTNYHGYSYEELYDFRFYTFLYSLIPSYVLLYIVIYMTIYKDDTKKYEKDLAEYDDWRKDQNAKNEARRKRKEREKKKRERDIIDRFGEKFGRLILDDKIELGMTREMMVEAWGEPGESKERVYKTSTKERCYFFPRITRQNTTVYKVQVNLEDGIIVGWRDLE